MSDLPMPTDGTGLIRLDPWLDPFAGALRQRQERLLAARGRIREAVGSVEAMSRGAEWFGFNRGMDAQGKLGVWYREWAPAAQGLNLIGDFNEWNREATPLTRDAYGVWSVFLPDATTGARLTHGSRLKVHVRTVNGGMDRIPAWIRRVIQDPGQPDYCAQYWAPETPYRWRHERPTPIGAAKGKGGTRQALRIYEAHVGMAGEAEQLGTYSEFTSTVLPRIARLGYNAVQLMAVQEHPYYGSFGYHVSSLFAASSRFGTPEELKELIDTAHGLGLLVLIDIVHSHAVKNLNEGLSGFDGTDHQYFHAGSRGQHVAWDSLCYDYGKFEVQRFLLSNVRFWLTEYRFDGLRFDGVTSMLYLDHGLGKDFTCYDDYFGDNIDPDAVTYLQLANEVAHLVLPAAISIAEDMSGMVGTARPVAEGGLGFDYRLAMGIPDYWIKLLKEKQDDDWNLGDLYGTLLNRRHSEGHVAYAESHDQALVGDKTLAFRLMDAAMYWHMNNDSHEPVIDRGIALHKLLRLLTFSLGGNAYLNFMGNEFGHPEWIDFPREGNGGSFKHARRQWSLVDSPFLRYSRLNAFDMAMLALDTRFGILSDPLIEQLLVDEPRKLLVYRRGPLVIAINLHPTASVHDHRIPVPDRTDYALVLSTDAPELGGFGNVAMPQRYIWQSEPLYGRAQTLLVYLPSRVALVLAPVGLVGN